MIGYYINRHLGIEFVQILVNIIILSQLEKKFPIIGKKKITMVSTLMGVTLNLKL